MRNFRNKLDEKVSKIRQQPGLKRYLKLNLERIRKDVCSAVKFRIKENKDGITSENEAIINIKEDIVKPITPCMRRSRKVPTVYTKSM